MNETLVSSLSGTKPVNFKLDLMEEWRDTLSSYAQEYGNIYIVSDTETTDVNLFDFSTGFLHRVVEWALCFCYKDKDGYLNLCKDSKDRVICIDEPINPFISDSKSKGKTSVSDMGEGSVDVHGLTVEYLFGEGKSPKNRPMLNPEYGAPTFSVVMDLLQEITNSPPLSDGSVLITAVFHNQSFDMKFLNSEAEWISSPPLESFFRVEDTMTLVKDVLLKKVDVESHKLDDIYKYGQDNYPELTSNTDRPYHSAMVDSLILVQAYNVIHKVWLEKKNK